ncbi:hypothetical protein Tco_0022774, partial [Tanacetum coccineum]
INLEKEKDAQAVEILKLKQRVNKLERKRKSSISHPRRRIYSGGKVIRQSQCSDDDLDEEDASKQWRKSDKTKSMFQDSDFDVLDDDMEDVKGETVHTATARVSAVSAPVNTAGVAISTAEPRTPPTTAATTLIDEDLTISQTLIKMKEEKAKEKGVAFKYYTIEERARLLAERAEAIRNKPPTRTQVRNRMITYLKHMGKYTHQQLKHKNFEEVQKLYEREKNWIDDFKPINDDSQQQAESIKKRPIADSEEESSKKQKLEEDNDAEK